jgi:hypothetical protein
MNTRNTYREYETFNAKGTPRLRAYNRISTFFSIVSQLSVPMAQEYIKQFSTEDRAEINTMMEDLKADYTGTRKELSEAFGNE